MMNQGINMGLVDPAAGVQLSAACPSSSRTLGWRTAAGDGSLH
jgi:hypothetical protein